MGRNIPFFPTCGSPSKTVSFRAPASMTGDFDDMAATSETESSLESVIRGLSSDRFFFKPGKTSSILEEAKVKEKEKEKQSVLPFKESVSMMEMESTDPFIDFKKSMQEMVEADEGLKEWDNLQELLSLYLAVNEKINHGYIIGAFVDVMLVNLGSTSSSSSSSCSSSSLMNGQDQSLLTESGSSSNNTKKKTISSKSPDSALSFTSSSASASASISSSSTSHCLSSCSLEEEDEDHNSPHKAASVSDDDSSLKI